VALAVAPAITIQSPSNNQFFFSGSTCTTQCNITNSPTGNIYVYYPDWQTIASGRLSLTSGTTYKGSFTITYSGNGYPGQLTSGQYIGFEQFEVSASNSSGPSYAYRYYAVTYNNQSFYTQRATNMNTSAFIYPNSPKYNCFAYAVGVFNSNLAPDPNQSDLNDFFEKKMRMQTEQVMRMRLRVLKTIIQTLCIFPVITPLESSDGIQMARLLSWNQNGEG
jgi:hypothetical protein